LIGEPIMSAQASIKLRASEEDIYFAVGSGGNSMRRAHPTLWILFLFLLGGFEGRAVTQPCAWLNAATAAGVLEGPVTVRVTYINQEHTDAACEYTHQADKTVDTLRIEVDTMKDLHHDFPRYIARCGQNAKPLRAIGNEAVVCSVPGTNRQIAEEVVSRVRDRAFIVDVVSNGSAAERDTILDKAQKVAQQVAGSLF
jgi:hypothetical protein